MEKIGKDPSMRELFLLRNEARDRLMEFLSGISSWPERQKFSHFLKGSDANLKRFDDLAESLKETLALIDSAALKDKKYFYKANLVDGWEAARPAEEYLSAFFSLLEKTISATTALSADSEELRILGDALNMPSCNVGWNEKTRTIVTEAYGPREAGESLMAYINQIARCGPVHASCADCGVMFMRKKGERQSCEPCSRRHQTYAYRKQYLLAKKKEYYQRNKTRDEEERSALQGAKTKKGAYDKE